MYELGGIDAATSASLMAVTQAETRMMKHIQPQKHILEEKNHGG